MGGSNVGNVTVSCTTNSYSVGGTVSGLVGSVVLQNNGSNTTTISTSGTSTFSFSTLINQGSGYSVSISTQPATQTCVLANNTGTMGGSNVGNVTVT